MKVPLCVRPSLQPFLDSLTRHSRLRDTEQKAILGLPTHLFRAESQRDFVPLGEIVDHVSVVVDGIVARFAQNAEGERQIIAFYIAGDAPDLHTLVVQSDAVPLQALTKATILRIPHAALRKVAAHYPAVAEAFWRHCSIDAAITAKWVVNGRRDAKTGLSHLLCEMAVRTNANTGRREVTFSFPLTQAHLADASGITKVHVNRILKALAAEGFVTLCGRTARIPDWERLVERGQFEAEYLQAGLRPRERLRNVG